MRKKVKQKFFNQMLIAIDIEKGSQVHINIDDNTYSLEYNCFDKGRMHKGHRSMPAG